MLKKGQEYIGIVEKMDFPNKGILHIEETKVTVKNALPGQQIRFSVSKTRKGRCEGRLKEVIKPSSAETKKDVCSHFGMCGGCTYQSLPYEEQLKIKEGQVKELLRPLIEVDKVFEGIKPSPVEGGYRNKMEYSFGDEFKGGPLSLGMHKRGSFHDIVTVSDCRIADEDYQSILMATCEYFREKQIPFYQKMRHEGYLRHLLVRKGVKTGEILVVLVTSGDFPRGSLNGNPDTLCALPQGVAADSTKQVDFLTETQVLSGYKEHLLQLTLKGSIAGILHTVNNSLADVVQSDETNVLFGKDYFYEELLGLRFKITPFSFFQTNSLGAEVLYSVVRDYLGDTKDQVVYDLYSGTGTIAQIAASVAENVIGVEIVEEAVVAARDNAGDNGLSNCEFILGDVLKVLDEIEEKPDLIILDPPRDGIHPKALPKIIGYGARTIVYVSCKPTSLVRDLKVFLDSGYQVVRCCGVDMFPFSGNVETVVSLSLKNGTMGENYNKSKKENPEVKHCPQEKIGYI